MALDIIPVNQELHNQIAAVAPIFGVSIGNHNDKSTWRVDFQPSATEADRSEAQAVIGAFDVAAEMQKIQNEKDRYIQDSGMAKAEQSVKTLAAMTPAEAKAWVQANVNNFADAKALLGTMATVLCVLSRHL